MEYLDTTVIATALPQMAHSFGVGPNALSIGMTAYMLALAIFIPVSGWVADRVGSRTVFFSAIVVFVIASVLCGLSNSVAEFTAARLLQGAGGAMMVPVGRLIVVRSTEKSRLMQAISTITWPAIAPIAATVVLIRLIEAFKIIDIPNVLTAGGPGLATESMTLHSFIAWRTQDLGGSAAIGYLLLFVSTITCVSFFNYVVRWTRRYQ